MAENRRADPRGGCFLSRPGDSLFVRPGEEPPDVRVAAVAHVEAQLLALEPLFHNQGASRAGEDCLAQTTEDFWKVTSCGRVYERRHVIERLRGQEKLPEAEHWVVSDVRCRRVGESTYAFTYRLDQGGRPTRRLTLWQRDSDGWKALYHQGTLIQDDYRSGGLI